MDRYRCRACGNRTRFDVVATRKTKAFWHYDLGGVGALEEEEVLFDDVESVTCRWCGNKNQIDTFAEGTEISEDESAPIGDASSS